MSEPSLKQIGEQIRKQRVSKGVKQETLAKELNLSLTGYAKIERGESDFSINRLFEIAKHFNVEPFELLGAPNNYNAFNNNVGFAGGTHNHGEIKFSEDKIMLEKILTELSELKKRIEKLEK